MIDFLRRFFEGTKHNVELRTVPISSRAFSRTPQVLSTFLETHAKANLYFGCATREGTQFGTKEFCREIPALWTDIDFKDVAEIEAKKSIEDFPFKPSLIIASGGGWHVYWLLKEPHDAQDRKCERILKGLATALQGDPQATDISRILRVPETLNHKYTPPRKVTIVREDWELRYTLSDFDMYEETEVAESPIETRTGKVAKGGRTSSLVSLAGFMNRKGHPFEEIEAALIATNARFDPPFSDREVRKKARDIFERYKKQHGNGRVSTEEIERTIEHITADKIEPEPLQWLWENRIPLGKLTVFCGMPDTGKSTVAIDIASRCTTGLAWPEDIAIRRAPCDVLMLISEDDLKDTTVPRLIAAGARLNQIHFAIQTIVEQKEKRVERRIAFDADLGALEAMLVQNPEIKLIIVDPLGSYLGKLKKNAEEDIRAVLTDLKELAERANVAILSIDHFNKKNEQSGLQRLSGAGALAAVPRAVWAFVKDTDDKSLRLMLNAKLNVVSEAKKEGLKYYSVGVEIVIKNVQSNLPVIQWCGASQGDLDEILHVQSDPEKTKRGKCVKWLTERLADGEVLSETIYREAESKGMSVRTVKNATKDMGVDNFQRLRRWYMKMPGGENAGD